MKRIIFLHGVGGTGASVRPLLEALTLTVTTPCPDGTKPFAMGPGRRWFSVKGVAEANRPACLAAALPAFIQTVAAFGNPRDGL